MTQYRIIIPKQILIWVSFAIVLTIVRVVLFGSSSFLYLIWNLFLAFIPFMISSVLWAHQKEGILSPILFCVGFILWLLVFPNAPYVVTDLIHVGANGRGVAILYDAIMLFVCAWAGLILGFYSLAHIEHILRTRLTRPRIVDVAVLGISLLAGFGMYLGRFLRFNSWDIVADPLALLTEVGQKLFVENAHVHLLGYTLLFGFFIFISYRAWKYDTTYHVS